MTLSPGTKLGPYEILAHIGAGGMGEVWKARDTRLGRIVAIKKVKERHSKRFKQEARSIAALNHPYGACADGGYVLRESTAQVAAAQSLAVKPILDEEVARSQTA
jgi:serine/threonine protein kinase